jgi:hypothetical protein
MIAYFGARMTPTKMARVDLRTARDRRHLRRREHQQVLKHIRRTAQKIAQDHRVAPLPPRPQSSSRARDPANLRLTSLRSILPSLSHIRMIVQVQEARMTFQTQVCNQLAGPSLPSRPYMSVSPSPLERNKVSRSPKHQRKNSGDSNGSLERSTSPGRTGSPSRSRISKKGDGGSCFPTIPESSAEASDSAKAKKKKRASGSRNQ